MDEVTPENRKDASPDRAGGDNKVLMVCYFYPPMRATGVTRSKEFVKHLPGFGWQPVVLSVKNPKDPWTTDFNEKTPSNVEVFRALELNIPRLLRILDGVREKLLKLFRQRPTVNYFHDRLGIPDHYFGWMPYFKGVRLARQCRCVYVSCSPFSAAISGLIIGLIARRPVILDFRDAWTLNPYMPHSNVHRIIARWQERWALKRSSKVILNTRGALDLYKKNYPEMAEKFTYIPNGYDELPEFNKDTSMNELFTIIHLGQFYGPRQPDLLLAALAKINNPSIQFVQVGKPFESLARFKDRVNIKVVPPLSHVDALAVMQSASLLYLKQGQVPGVGFHIAVAAKTYEYLATGVPILAECPPGDNADILREYAAQCHLLINPAEDDLEAAILEAFEKRHNKKKTWPVKPEFKEKFNRKNLTKELVEQIEYLL